MLDGDKDSTAKKNVKRNRKSVQLQLSSSNLNSGSAGATEFNSSNAFGAGEEGSGPDFEPVPLTARSTALSFGATTTDANDALPLHRHCPAHIDAPSLAT